jgi:hypothetical protein
MYFITPAAAKATHPISREKVTEITMSIDEVEQYISYTGSTVPNNVSKHDFFGVPQIMKAQILEW